MIKTNLVKFGTLHYGVYVFVCCSVVEKVLALNASVLHALKAYMLILAKLRSTGNFFSSSAVCMTARILCICDLNNAVYFKCLVLRRIV